MQAYALAATLVLWSSALSAQADELTLKLSGVGFNGGPAFEAAIGGQVIATGVVEAPTPEGEDFTFTVPDGLLAGNGDLTLRLTNDYFAGEDQDRSLLVLGATVGNQELTAESFVVVNAGQVVERDRSAGVPLWSGEDIAVANAPADGWLGERTMGETRPECTASAEILGMASGSFSLDDEADGALGPVIEAARSGTCSVTLTGYADTSGTEAANYRLTAARSAAVLDALIAAGARFPNANIVATTGTDQFGPDAANNRRVTVQLWAPEGQDVAGSTPTPENAVSQLAREAAQADLAHLLAMGWRSTGELYLRSSNTDPQEVLWLIEQVKARLIAGEPVLGPGQ